MITLLCATRERPHRFAKCLQSFEDTTARSWEMIVMLDSDDPTLIEYYAILSNKPHLLAHVAPSTPVGHRLNQMWPNAHGDIIACVGDDVICRTLDWDIKARTATPEIVPWLKYPLDGYNDAPTHFIMSRPFIQALGYICHPAYMHTYADQHLYDVACAAGCAARADYILWEHMHPFADKAPVDATYIRGNALETVQTDAETYKRLVKERIEDAKRVREVI